MTQQNKIDLEDAQILKIVESRPVKQSEQSSVSNHLNEISCSKLDIDLTTPRCNRARLDTGPFCNYDCDFCYYRELLHIQTPFELVKERIDYIHSYGITQIDLSGGESSVSPDWFKILDYCKDKFERVSCLSHGGRFHDKKFLQQSKDAGLKEILFSLHGPTEEAHDSITNRKGSFKRILKAITNAKELGIMVRLNCTVYFKNIDLLREHYAELVNSIDPYQINFITLNYWSEHITLDFHNDPYDVMTTEIKACIDQINKGIEINVRYVPYCYMKGYEQYVCDEYQHIYDVRDWNKEVFTYSVDVSKQYTEEEKLQMAYAEAGKQRIRFYSKKFDCMKCKHYYICDGVEKEIIDETPVYPEAGDKITQVNYYRNK